MRRSWFAALSVIGGLLLGLPGSRGLAEVSEHTRLVLETLDRLKGSAPTVSPSLQQAASRVADQVRGEPEFVELVEGFQLKGREAELLQFAATHSESSQAGKAVRLALNGDGVPLVRAMLSTDAPSPDSLLSAMAASGDPRCLPLAQPLLNFTNRPLATRELALKVLATSGEGASNLLASFRSGNLPPDLREASLEALRASRLPEVRAAVQAVAPAPPKGLRLVLPPASEWATLAGDPKRGQAVFRRPDVACSSCHQVGGEGMDFGPKLTEIGAKLGKEALIAAIADPSAGISFGYEAWQITVKDGDEFLGLVASETDQELSLKQQGGQIMTIKKSDIVTRQKQATSIMPSGLHENLTLAEFGDLIAYLASLKAAAL